MFFGQFLPRGAYSVHRKASADDALQTGLSFSKSNTADPAHASQQNATSRCICLPRIFLSQLFKLNHHDDTGAYESVKLLDVGRQLVSDNAQPWHHLGLFLTRYCQAGLILHHHPACCRQLLVKLQSTRPAWNGSNCDRMHEMLELQEFGLWRASIC